MNGLAHTFDRRNEVPVVVVVANIARETDNSSREGETIWERIDGIEEERELTSWLEAKKAIACQTLHQETIWDRTPERISRL